MTTPIPLNLLRWGSPDPLPAQRLLRAGPLTTVLEQVTLRYVRAGEHEVVRGLYAAVRDRNWGTPQPHFTRFDVNARSDSFSVRFTAEHVDPTMGVDFIWDGAIEGTPDGQITYTMDGHARATFLRNRIGFCLLHAADLAGTPVDVLTTTGQTLQGVFPVAISPHQPFFDVRGFRQHLHDGATFEVIFDGDVFEMEDQRNWTDASYKTYCTPLALPYPAEIPAGTHLHQSVTLRLLGGPTSGAAVPSSSAHAEPVTIAVSSTPIAALPPIGFGVASHGQPLEQHEVERLRTLHPAHLRATLHLAQDTWRATLEQSAHQAQVLGAGLELEIVGDDPSDVQALATVLSRLQVPLARALIFPSEGVVTTETALACVREAFRAAGIDAPVGGGTRADFVNLNRADAAGALPVAQMDVVGYAINPQVHTFDNGSIVETLVAQVMTVQNARRIARGRPVVVGPVTLRQRINPAATAPEAASSNPLPPRADPRQLSLFTAAWAIGSLRRLASAGAGALTYFETTGPLGLMERTAGWQPHPAFPSQSGQLFPVYHVFAVISRFASNAASGTPVELLDLTPSDPLSAEALALRAGGSLLLLIANVRGEPQRVRLQMPTIDGGSLRLLNETAYPAAWHESAALPRVDLPPSSPDGLTLTLHPYAVALIDT